MITFDSIHEGRQANILYGFKGNIKIILNVNQRMEEIT